MAYLYADFETQATDALRLARLRQHMAEVEAEIDANVSKGGASRASDPLNAKMDRLERRRDALERRVAQQSPMTRASMFRR